VKIFTFAFVLITVGLIAMPIIEFLGFPLDIASYIAGMFVAGVIDYLLGRLGKWRSAAARPNQRQSVEIETEETPNEILSAASMANRNSILLIIALLVILLGLFIYFFGYSPDIQEY